MPGKPGEHKTVQARILAYAQEIGWKYVPRNEAEARRGFDTSKETPAEQGAEASPYFDDLLDAQVRLFNPSMPRGRARSSGSCVIFIWISPVIAISSLTSATPARSTTGRLPASSISC